MNNSYIIDAGSRFNPEPNENIMINIFKQYENVIIESLITSFGLDFLIKDQYGGDVDTIHNIRRIGKDGQMTYKNSSNQANYDNRGEYNSYVYHSDKRYIDKNREFSDQKQAGTLKDAYTGEKIARNEKSDLDHVISAKEIHDDAGRVLSGLCGTDLANRTENLQATNPHTNRSKKADSMNEFINKKENEYTDSQKDNMLRLDAQSRKSYEAKLAKAYYTSPKFAKDVASAAGKVSAQMGLRQALGFVFAEIWFAIKKEFVDIKIDLNLDLGEFFTAIGNGIKHGFANAKEKYNELFSRFFSGTIAGCLSSLTTTLCNIFFTTAKNVVNIIRQSYASLVQALKVLFINPDNLPFGERMRACAKILATGASIVVGVIVSEAIEKTPIGLIPVIGDIIKTFCGTLVTGVMSCTLLYFLDRSQIINKLVNTLNGIHTISTIVNYYRQQAAYFEEYAAKLMEIDINKFRNEIAIYSTIAANIENVKTEEDLNAILKNAIRTIGFKIPWEEYGNFDNFMNNKNAVIIFE